MKNRNTGVGDNWETPEHFYNELNEEFNFDFDPCPLMTGHITPQKDGLLIPWRKSNFINPPYSRVLKEKFVKKAIEVANEGALCVLLLPVSTSSVLFHEHILPNAKEIRFVKGRVKFKGVNSKGDYVTDKTGMHDSMVVIFGEKQ